MAIGFIDPGGLDELQVVEECNDVVQDGECDECVMACGCTAEEQVELAEETSERRDACQAEHRNGKGNAKARVLFRKATERLECFFTVVSDNAENEEREVVRNGIDKEVIDDCRLCGCCRAEQCHHDVTGLSDRAVSHETAEAALL